MIRTILGCILIIIAIPLGLYVGLWLCFILGIVQIIEAFKATPVEALGVAIGLVRVLIASSIGVVSAVFMFLGGLGLIASTHTKYSNSISSRKRP